ncbi:hypothetical protein [Devosia sp.]|uniref:hypothetical protein n=1 Tax=Devosia sp. TaxID=1871048 RepID=UPI003265686B
MATIFSAFKSAGRVAVITLALGASTLVAVPAFAQGPVVSFGLQFGGGNNDNGPRHGNGWGDDDWDNGGNYQRRCLTNREVRQQVSQYGYSQVNVVRELSRQRVDVTAVRGNWVYAMRVDKCSGQVSQPQRVSRIGGGGFPGNGYPGNRPGNGGGFGFEFNFSN